MVTITVNGVRREIQAPDDTPLLYVLRNDLELSGPQFGCGLSQCGACSVLLDGKEIRSCVDACLGGGGQGSHHTGGTPREVGQAEGPVAGVTRKRRFIPFKKPGSRSKRLCAASARAA